MSLSLKHKSDFSQSKSVKIHLIMVVKLERGSRAKVTPSGQN